MLDAILAAKIMEREGCPCPVAAYDTIDSTNLELKRRIAAGCALPQLVIADGQTAGRGRLGRCFESPDGSGVYFSLAFRADGSLENTTLVTTAAAVAVREAIERETGLSCGIKWVNDLYLGGKKVCGILAEAVGGCVIVGIGINITTEFSGELSEKAASLGKECSHEALAALSCAGILRFLAGKMPDMIEKYRAHSIVLGKEITYFSASEPPKRARARDIYSRGGLIVELNDGGEETLRTGEISIRMEDYK